ncbi:MAG: glycosyltransferase [Clostridia bacterium]|nr:glycosyltransferase [Clostridia bacterium]
MQPVKVLQVNKFYSPVTGGIETLVKQYSEELSKYDDIELEVLCCQKERAKTQIETVNGIKVTRMSSLGTYFSCPLSLSFIREFRRKARNADVIEIHVPFPLADFAVTFSRIKGKLFVAWHSDIVKQEKVMFFIKPFMKRLLERANNIIVATEGHISGSKYLPSYKEKCIVIPYGIDSSQYNPDSINPEYRSILTEKLTNSSSRKALFVGRLVYYKGVDVLIKAFGEVHDTELFICGEGPLESSLKKLASDMNMSGKIHFLNYLTDEKLKAAYNDCDFFVLPSVQRSEAFALVQAEAMIYGKPVINTNLPSGVPYVSLDKVTGITVTPCDTHELAAAINILSSDDELRHKYGDNARERVLNVFNKDKVIEYLHTLFVK